MWPCLFGSVAWAWVWNPPRNAFLNDLGLPQKALALPQKDLAMPQKGSALPEKDLALPQKGSALPEEDLPIFPKWYTSACLVTSPLRTWPLPKLQDALRCCGRKSHMQTGDAHSAKYANVRAQ